MRWFLGIVVVTLVSSSAYADSLEERLKREQAALDSLKTSMEARQLELDRSRKKERSVAETLSRQEQEMVGLRGELRGLKRRRTDLGSRLSQTKQELGEIERRLGVRETGMKGRMRKMYKLGRRGPLEILLSSDSFTQGLRRARYLVRVAEQDRRDRDAIISDRRRVSRVANLQGIQYTHQKELLKAKVTAEQRLEKMVTRRERELQRIRTDVSDATQSIQQMAEEMAASSERIAEIIKEIQARQRLTSLPDFDFPAHRGFLPRPVAGRVLLGFGNVRDPELGTSTFNRGIKIDAAQGVDVIAVAPGEVVLVDWFPGYGQFVLLRHQEGFYSLYGHLSAVMVEKGQILAQGGVLGAVGSTGRIDGRPQLHFEVMEGEVPRDPSVWLEE